VFREDNGINQQIVLYLLSRIVTGLGRLGVKKGIYRAPEQSFAITASVVWGVVMYLFRHEEDTLQGSLRVRMIC
jgi:peroxisomal membrane protein 4